MICDPGTKVILIIQIPHVQHPRNNLLIMNTVKAALCLNDAQYALTHMHLHHIIALRTCNIRRF